MKVRHKQHPDVMVDLDANTQVQWLAGLPKDEWELVPLHPGDPETVLAFLVERKVSP